MIQDDPNEELILYTCNIKTGTTGVAVFYNDNKTIKVYEGNGDGSDDKEMDYKDFIENYYFFVGHEIDQSPIAIKI